MKKNNTTFIIEVVIAVAVGLGIAAVLLFDTTGKKGSGLGKEFDYDIAELMKVDPALIIYKELGQSLETGFKAAKAFAIDARGRMYVVGDTAIRVIKDGKLSMEINLSGEPRCVAVDGDRIYVGVDGRIEVYGQFGGRVGRWDSLGERAVLTSIAVSKGNVFVADAGNRVVYRYNTDGKLLGRIGEKDKSRGVDGFSIPSPYFDLAIGDDGLLRVVNPGRHRIEAYTFDGDLEFSWGSPSNVKIAGFCGCCNPVNFAILPDGDFVTCEKGLARVKVYDSYGKFAGVVAGAEQLLDGLGKICNLPEECQKGGFDVAVDSDGKVYVLDTINNTIKTFVKKSDG